MLKTIKAQITTAVIVEGQASETWGRRKIIQPKVDNELNYPSALENKSSICHAPYHPSRSPYHGEGHVVT